MVNKVEKEYRKWLKDNKLKLSIFSFGDWFQKKFWDIKNDKEFDKYTRLRKIVAEEHLDNISKKLKEEIHGN